MRMLRNTSAATAPVGADEAPLEGRDREAAAGAPKRQAMRGSTGRPARGWALGSAPHCPPAPPKLRKAAGSSGHIAEAFKMYGKMFTKVWPNMAARRRGGSTGEEHQRIHGECFSG